MSKIRRNLRRRWDQFRAPWPIVSECHGHLISLAAPLGERAPKCRQCDGSHEHEWRAWPGAPAWVTAGPGVPVRCRKCGARKCDLDGCEYRRHDHQHAVDGAR